ncbi:MULTISPECIES: hypothetical protein [unclassified Streptomyces]|uniref:hypothetical protein n=1 Tax=unclassified Streptomyces TaxID=2593676 RepID=UPI00093AE9D8|nr:hypothetical protein [Streptomyces sp. CB02058]OKI94459.1 hypothetical protein AMK10_19365 [Streptomyces sp. CB02058]
MTPTDLGAAEQRLWTAYPHGGWVDAADTAAPAGDGPAPSVRAEVIRALLLGAREPEPGQVAGLRLRNARITGTLDLLHATVDSAVVLEGCRFDEPPRLAQSTLRSLRVYGCRMPGFDGAGMRVEGRLDLRAGVVAGGVRLDRARIEGEVMLGGALLGEAGDGLALGGDGMTVGGGLDCGEGFVADGQVLLRGARIEGPVSLEGATVRCPGADALILDRAVVNDRILAPGLTVIGRFRMFNATIAGSIQLSGSRLSNPGGMALGAGGLSVRGAVWCSDSFAAEGEVRLIGAEMGANLTLDGAVLGNPGGSALTLDRATVTDVHATGMTVDGGHVTLVGAQIRGRLDLRRTRLGTDGEDVALDAEAATVGDSILCQDMRSAAAVRLCGAVVAGSVLFTGARLAARDHLVLDLRLIRAVELLLSPAEPIRGMVNLEHAQLGVLGDDPERWPAELGLDGLTYEALKPELPATSRLRWLARDPSGPRPQPYEQLAALYVRAGDQAEARRVLYAKERRQRRGRPPLSRTWGALQDVTVGYGYRPWRAALWLLLLHGIGSVAYAVSPPPPLKPDETPHFNAVAYATDLLLPLVDLGQERAFNPAGCAQWLSYLLIAGGWILATTVAAGVARALSRP